MVRFGLRGRYLVSWGGVAGMMLGLAGSPVTAPSASAAAPGPASARHTIRVLCDGIGEVELGLSRGARGNPAVRVLDNAAVRVAGTPGFAGTSAAGRPVRVAAAGLGAVCRTQAPTTLPATDVLTTADVQTGGIDPTATVTGTLSVIVEVDTAAVIASAQASLAAMATPTGIPGDPAGYGSVVAAPVSSKLAAYFATRSGSIASAYRPWGSMVIYQASKGSTLNVTASIAKVQIMATVMKRAQDAGRGLTSWEVSQIVPMIRYSDNTAATNLWNSVGRGPAVARVNALMGLRSTVMSSTGAWGLTVTSAPDQVVLMDHFARSNPVLTDSMRAYGIKLMRSVTSSQAWGVTAGPPAGSTAVKNGWLPRTDGWHVNSIGAVSSGARSYSIGVLTHNTTASMSTQIATIAGTSRIIWSSTAGFVGVRNGGRSLANVVAGRCLDVPRGSSVPGNPVQLYTCNGTAAQQWLFTGTPDAATGALGSGALRVFTDRCLDVQDGNLAVGTSVRIWSCNGTAAQTWTLTARGAVQTPTGLCLATVGSGQSNGTLLELANCTNGSDQTWAGPAPSNGGQPVRHTASGLCLDVPGGSAVIGTQLQLWNCNGSAAQQVARTDSLGALVYANECLDVAQGLLVAGSAVQVWSCNGTDGQAWSLAADGSLRTANGLCLAPLGDGTTLATVGAKLALAVCDGGSSQQFTAPSLS